MLEQGFGTPPVLLPLFVAITQRGISVLLKLKLVRHAGNCDIACVRDYDSLCFKLSIEGTENDSETTWMLQYHVQ